AGDGEAGAVAVRPYAGRPVRRAEHVPRAVLDAAEEVVVDQDGAGGAALQLDPTVAIVAVRSGRIEPAVLDGHVGAAADDDALELGQVVGRVVDLHAVEGGVA